MKMPHINGNEKIGNAKNDQTSFGSSSERFHLLGFFFEKTSYWRISQLQKVGVQLISKINHWINSKECSGFFACRFFQPFLTIDLGRCRDPPFAKKKKHGTVQIQVLAGFFDVGIAEFKHFFPAKFVGFGC